MSSFNLNGALCSRVMVQCEVGACKLGNREKTDEEPVKKGSLNESIGRREEGNLVTQKDM